jgi:hypothetical protein
MTKERREGRKEAKGGGRDGRKGFFDRKGGNKSCSVSQRRGGQR